jgi:hypothetical protein
MIKLLALPFLGFIGSALCATAVVISQEVTILQNSAIIYFILVPSIYLLLSLFYFTYFHYSSPLMTAIFFSFFILFIDIGANVSFIQKVYALLICFTVTFLVGLLYYRFFRGPDEAPPAF